MASLAWPSPEPMFLIRNFENFHNYVNRTDLDKKVGDKMEEVKKVDNKIPKIFFMN
jgi:hypothetical protein